MLTGTDDTAENFYPRPPGGGRQHAPPSNVLTNCISIHALRVEGDQQHFFLLVRLVDFYPRPPGGGRLVSFMFSIPHRLYFYPRPPGGGRPITSFSYFHHFHFYPRPPGGGRPSTRKEVSFR